MCDLFESLIRFDELFIDWWHHLPLAALQPSFRFLGTQRRCIDVVLAVYDWLGVWLIIINHPYTNSTITCTPRENYRISVDERSDVASTSIRCFGCTCLAVRYYVDDIF